MILRSADEVVGGSVLGSLGQDAGEMNRDGHISTRSSAPRAVGTGSHRCIQDLRRPGTDVFEGDYHQASPDRGTSEGKERKRGSLCDFDLASPDRLLQNAADDPRVCT